MSPQGTGTPARPQHCQQGDSSLWGHSGWPPVLRSCWHDGSTRQSRAAFPPSSLQQELQLLVQPLGVFGFASSNERIQYL